MLFDYFTKCFGSPFVKQIKGNGKEQKIIINGPGSHPGLPRKNGPWPVRAAARSSLSSLTAGPARQPPPSPLSLFQVDPATSSLTSPPPSPRRACAHAPENAPTPPHSSRAATVPSPAHINLPPPLPFLPKPRTPLTPPGCSDSSSISHRSLTPFDVDLGELRPRQVFAMVSFTSPCLCVSR